MLRQESKLRECRGLAIDIRIYPEPAMGTEAIVGLFEHRGLTWSQLWIQKPALGIPGTSNEHRGLFQCQL